MAHGFETLLLDMLSADPSSPEEGQIWWNTTEQALKLREGAITVILANNTEHPALRQLIHFVEDGPAEGFASGSYRETTGGLFPTSIIWYDQAGLGRKKIYEKLYTWTGVVPTTIVRKMYDSSETVIATLTDTITYSGLYETSRTRTLT